MTTTKKKPAAKTTDYAETLYARKGEPVYAKMLPLNTPDQTEEADKAVEDFIDWALFVDLEYSSGHSGSIELSENGKHTVGAEPGEWIVKLGEGDFDVFTQEDFDANFEKPQTDAGVLEKLKQEHADNLDLLKAANAGLDKIGEMAKENARIAQEFDANVERLKACEHIAEGDEGWELIRSLCPSTMAVADLRGQLEAARKDHEGACKTVALMHAAAVGEVTGPKRGVVEDVADVHARALFAEKAVRDLDAAHRLDHPEGSESCRTCGALDAVDSSVAIFGQPSWLARMMKALERYADSRNWEWFTDTRGFKEGGLQALRWKGGSYRTDGGDFARDALANVEPGHGCALVGCSIAGPHDHTSGGPDEAR